MSITEPLANLPDSFRSRGRGRTQLSMMVPRSVVRSHLPESSKSNVAAEKPASGGMTNKDFANLLKKWLHVFWKRECDLLCTDCEDARGVVCNCHLSGLVIYIKYTPFKHLFTGETDAWRAFCRLLVSKCKQCCLVAREYSRIWTRTSLGNKALLVASVPYTEFAYASNAKHYVSGPSSSSSYFPNNTISVFNCIS